MGGETQVIVAIFKGIVWILSAPYSELAPFVDRVLYLVIVLFVVKWMWRKITR